MKNFKRGDPLFGQLTSFLMRDCVDKKMNAFEYILYVKDTYNAEILINEFLSINGITVSDEGLTCLLLVSKNVK